MEKKYPISRRDFIRLSAAVSAGVTILPAAVGCSGKPPQALTRNFGRLNFKVTTLGLGGQGSIQSPPEDVDPTSIIIKAFDLGINYFDTSNVYGPSQLNYNKAFKKLKLIPGESVYNEKLRHSIMLTSKTAMKWGKPGWEKKPNVLNFSRGKNVKCAIGDLKRSLSQIFGDDNGYYPEGAYLDNMLIHGLGTFEEVEVLYKGLETPLNSEENFGALVALRDYRDGTNFTGTNPKKEKLINHIGFSGHKTPAVMMDFIQRDEFEVLDAMLVAINSNDKHYFNMQNNVIPVAKSKGLGIIAMKVFANSAMYREEPSSSKNPVYREVGSPSLPSNELIEYVLSKPEISTLIIGIGNIDEDPLKCQLTQNYYAAQILPNKLTKEESLKIEAKTSKIKNGMTNDFQNEKINLSSPRDIIQEKVGGKMKISWQTAYAAEAPISHYEILLDNKRIGKVKHAPQISKNKPFVFETEEIGKGNFVVYTVDEDGNRA